MSEKRFKLSKYVTPSSVSYFCDENGRMLNKEVVKVLNEQQATIQSLEEEIKLLKPTNIEQYEQIQKLQEENEQLQAQLREKEQDERLYANEIVKLNKEAKEVLDFKSLGGDY